MLPVGQFSLVWQPIAARRKEQPAGEDNGRDEPESFGFHDSFGFDEFGNDN